MKLSFEKVKYDFVNVKLNFAQIKLNFSQVIMKLANNAQINFRGMIYISNRINISENAHL